MIKVDYKVCVTMLSPTDIYGKKYDETGAGETAIKVKDK